MDPVEKAIRNALEKGNAEDRAFREKVYRSAFAALERSTQANPQLTVEMAIKRRQNLQARITSIESEYLPAAPALPVEPGEVPTVAIESDAAAAAAQAPEVETQGNVGEAGEAPAVALDTATEPAGGAPAVDLGATRRSRSLPGDAPPPAATVAPDRDERRARRRRGPMAAMFTIVTLLCAVAIGGWWAYQTGLLALPSASRVQPAPQLAESEDFDPAEETPLQAGEPGSTQALRNWITVFAPGDSSGVNAPSGATAEVSEDESGEFLRIRSGAEGAAVVFDVGQGILERIAGRKAVFDISARAEDGTQTEISISCDFGEMGDCGRQRYAVGYERGEYLFDVELPANPPGAGGSIAINSDFSNEGKAVDIYEIKVSTLE